MCDECTLATSRELKCGQTLATFSQSQIFISRQGGRELSLVN